MSTTGEVLIGLVMAIGLVGVVVPVLPGLLLIAIAVVVWAVAEGGTTAWGTAVVVLAVLALGTYLKYRLPGRQLKAQQVSRFTWLLVAVGGVVGFFVIPVVGAVLGVVLGCYVGEWHRLRGHRAAWASTTRVLVSIGKGMALEFLAGIVAIGIWLAAAIAM